MYCYTGFYKNTRVTVMGSGMGIPSIGIYSYELFKVYQVKTIIRIGSAGGFVKDLKLGDIVITDKAYSKSNYANDIGVKTPLDRVLQASPTLLKTCTNTAKKLQLTPHIGKILSEDAFYSAIP
jgi:purine-nucleoside phosphorylase